ncbi:enoyl-CoA hydratase/isomerase [Eleftheria terrae]|uniref:enoyl-CoA hydratase/isomerase n=1 Tax=Eleftheria terrae TaxID=1597781 RepID=UPI00263ADE02|nr:enoyl-CoA hydratase/isomerase [Eleftheria terrae]WKB56126.1 enoyl-CoA hydratase/isomerase [Eleftheria terrae]
MSYQTLKVRFQDSICFLQLDRPERDNAINGQLVAECHQVLSLCEQSATVVVLSGTPAAFCVGADFSALAEAPGPGTDAAAEGPGPLYDLWLRMATGPYVTVSHVRGKANAGGIGFVAASDVVLAEDSAQFSLSELLFGLYPACVLPFLTRRVGWQKAHYLTLMTHPVGAAQALEWGLVDAVDADSESLLRRHLLRLRRLSKVAITRYKTYMNRLGGPALSELKAPAVAANLEVFSDPANRQAIVRYVEKGVFPWEKG